MRTTIGRALLAALNAETGDHNAIERDHARRWLAGTTVAYSNAPDFKIVIRPDAHGLWWATLAYGVCGYSAADTNALVRVRVVL
jgi:hypothetical protein